ncbi:hypothetical protein C9374_005957 [Naegleria lovaniensis]|uniref:purine-nucleoside phosphorylase n=1 Tax=Naegleria lovaniensis TaxID=51637 RepID=A0AA88KJ96_NAELO|nr:uncharacterized protein C9374_005957 [Naegleria lovaniensis]KAG2381573.1 hypothetical protein C9374_005957 [Naegleria lovaniensis]
MVFVNEEIEQAKQKVLSELGYAPMAIVLGSGLGDFPKALSNTRKIPYSQIPHMPLTSVQGHSGELIIGELPSSVHAKEHGETSANKKKLIYCFAGRIHSYEGGPWDEVTFQVKLMAAIGCKLFILTNASGGLFDDMTGGCLCLLTGHFRLLARMDPNSLASAVRVFEKNNGSSTTQQQQSTELVRVEKNEFESEFEAKYSHFAPNFWTAKYVNLCRSIAKENNIKLFEGSYAWASGPSFETPLEVLMAKKLGGACVGMSTVPEMLTCNYYGMDCMGISLVCNLGAGLQKEPLTHKEVLENSKIGTEHIQLLVRETLANIEFEETSDAPLVSGATSDSTCCASSSSTTTQYVALKINTESMKITEENIKQAVQLIQQELGQFDENQINIYCTQQNVPNLLQDGKKVDLMTLPNFPYTSASGNFGYITKNAKNQLTLISNVHPSLDNTFTTEESFYLTLVFNVLNVQNVAFFVKCSDPRVTPENTVQEISSVTNFGHAQPLEYVESVYISHDRVLDAAPLSTNEKQTNSYMGFMGPDYPSYMECHLAQELGHSTFGVTSLNLFCALRYFGFNVKAFVEFSEHTSLNQVQMQIPSVKRSVKPVKYDQQCKLRYNILKYEEVVEATQFIKEQLDLGDKSIDTAIFDLNLNLPFFENPNVKIVKTLALSDIPHYKPKNGVSQALSLVRVSSDKNSTEKLVLVIHHVGLEQDESTYLLSNSLVDLTFFVRVCQHLQTVQSIYLNSAVSSALSELTSEPIYSPNTLVQYKDHINFTGYNPMIGKNENRWGDRFFDVSGLYHPLRTTTARVETSNVFYFNHALQLENRAIRTHTSKYNANILSSVGCYEALVAHHDTKEKHTRTRVVSLGLVVDQAQKSEGKLICPEKKKELVTVLCNDILGL